MLENKDFLTVRELADILHISRVAVFRKIKSGQIKAHKVGKAYIIDKRDLDWLIKKELTTALKQQIEKGVTKVINEYGETLKLLGRE